MGNPAIGSSWLRSVWAHCHHCHRELAVEAQSRSTFGSLQLWSGGERCHRELAVGVPPAVEVRWGTLGNTAFGSLRLRSGGEHCHRKLAVEVRWGALPSGAGRRRRSGEEIAGGRGERANTKPTRRGKIYKN